MIDKSYDENTDSAMSRLELREYRHRFWEVFCGFASTDQSIWHTGERWVTLHERKITPEKATAHIHGNSIYGVVGGKTTLTAALDHDLHGGDPSIFLDQFHVLATELPPQWHWQIANDSLNGVHHWCVLDQIWDTSLLRKVMRDWLIDLDRRHPRLASAAIAAGMKSFSSMELFPNPKCGFRLPLCVGRTMLLDQPLPLIENRRTKRKLVQDVVGYLRFIADPNRHRMSPDAAVQFLKERLPASPAIAGQTTAILSSRPPTPSQSTNGAKLEAVSGQQNSIRLVASPKGQHSQASTARTEEIGETATMKGQFAPALVNFWTGTNQSPDSLNTWIAMTARFLKFETTGENAAIQIIGRYVDDLPSIAFSDRLSAGHRKEVDRVIRSTVQRVFQEKDQTLQDPVRLRAAHEALAARGFRVSDKSTWHNASQKASGQTGKALEIGPDIDWMPNEKNLLLREMVPILKPRRGDENVVLDVAKFFLRYVYLNDEVPMTSIPIILSEFPIRFGKNEKRSNFIKFLLNQNWLWIRRKHWNNPIPGMKGSSRHYGVSPQIVERMRRTYMSLPPDERRTVKLNPSDQWLFERGFFRDV